MGDLMLLPQTYRGVVRWKNFMYGAVYPGLEVPLFENVLLWLLNAGFRDQNMIDCTGKKLLRRSVAWCWWEPLKSYCATKLLGLIGAWNPHVLWCTLGFLRSVRAFTLALFYGACFFVRSSHFLEVHWWCGFFEHAASTWCHAITVCRSKLFRSRNGCCLYGSQLAEKMTERLLWHFFCPDQFECPVNSFWNNKW